jgi:hypothetical protein
MPESEHSLAVVAVDTADRARTELRRALVANVLVTALLEYEKEPPLQTPPPSGVVVPASIGGRAT